MTLTNKKIALFTAEIYNEHEFWYPYYRLKEEGAEVISIGPERKTYTGKYGIPVEPDMSIDEADVNDFDALIIPGGYAPDHMRRKPAMIEFVKTIARQRKPVAAICHAGWMLASADVIRGVRLTSFSAIKDDLVNAGAKWEDKQVVVDKNFVTSRNPDDLPAFCSALIEMLTSVS